MTRSNPKRDPSSDPEVSTHTTNGNFAQKKLFSWFFPKIIPVIIGPINLLINANVMGVQEILSPRQTVLPKASVTDAVRSCAPIFWGTPGKVIRMSKDYATPRNIRTDENYRLSSPSPVSNPTSVSPTRTGNQYIASPSHPSITKRSRNAKTLDSPINWSLAINIHSTSYLSWVIVLEAVSGEVTNFKSLWIWGSHPPTQRITQLRLRPHYQIWRADG